MTIWTGYLPLPMRVLLPLVRPRWTTLRIRAHGEPNLPMMRRLWPRWSSSLKGQLKVGPKLSTITEDKKKGNKGEKGKKFKNKKDSSNIKFTKRKTGHGRKATQGRHKEDKKWASSPSIGANTTWRGRSTNLRIAHWANSTRTTKR